MTTQENVAGIYPKQIACTQAIGEHKSTKLWLWLHNDALFWIILAAIDYFLSLKV
jgi:hypothetical protein